MMNKDKYSSRVESAQANRVIPSTAQVEEDENTSIKVLEDVIASIPSQKVMTDADRFAFLEDDGGY